MKDAELDLWIAENMFDEVHYPVSEYTSDMNEAIKVLQQLKYLDLCWNNFLNTWTLEDDFNRWSEDENPAMAICKAAYSKKTGTVYEPKKDLKK